MKIAIASNTGDVNGPVSQVFGRAQYFILFEIVDKKIIETKVIENTASQQMGGAGVTAAQLIINQGVNVIITYTMGPRASGVLGPAGIELYQATQGSVSANIQTFMENKLKKDVSFGPMYRGMGFGRGAGQGMGSGRGKSRGR